jgi:hypothetical protein
LMHSINKIAQFVLNLIAHALIGSFLQLSKSFNALYRYFVPLDRTNLSMFMFKENNFLTA